MDEVMTSLENLLKNNGEITAPPALSDLEKITWRAGYRAGREAMQDEIRRVIDAARKRQVVDDERPSGNAVG